MLPESGSPQQSNDADPAGLVGHLGDLAGTMEESDRYRLLSAIFNRLAEAENGSSGRSQPTDQIRSLSQKVQELERTVAELEDARKALQADLEVRDKQVQASDLRLQTAQRTLEEIKSQLKDAAHRRDEAATRIAALEADLEEAHHQKEQLTLQCQRAEAERADRGNVDRLEQSQAALNEQIQKAHAELERVREEKNAEIEGLKAELLNLRAGAGAGGDRALADLWDKLASNSPPLSRGGQQPTPQAGARLVETTAELAGFVHTLDQNLRNFLNRYMKGSSSPQLQRSWRSYADRDDFWQLFQGVLDPVQGKPVGMLKIKLTMAQKWVLATLLAGDSAMENLSSELQAHLLGDHGIGADPKCTVRDYLRRNGPDLFQDHMCDLRRQNLAKAFGA